MQGLMSTAGVFTLTGSEMVACSGGSGWSMALSHRPLIFSLSATFRKDCRESWVMFTCGSKYNYQEGENTIPTWPK